MYKTSKEIGMNLNKCLHLGKTFTSALWEWPWRWGIANYILLLQGFKEKKLMGLN